MTSEVKERIEQIRHGNAPEGYKKTAACIIPNDWQCSAIRDCLKIKNNERQPISEEVRRNIPGPYPYYGPTQAQGYIDSYVSEGPAVLIGEDGDHFLKFKTKPMTLFVDGQYTVNNHAHMVVGTEQCTTKWFFYAYQHKSLLNAITRQGAGRYKLTKEALERLVVQYPCLEEQNRIIDIISRQDSVIELKEKLLEEKQRQKKYLMQQLLTGKKRLPGFDGEWKKVKLKKLLKERKTYSPKGAEYPHVTLSTEGIYAKSERYDRDHLVKNDDKEYKITHRGDICYNPANLKFGVICMNNFGDAIFSPIYVTFKVVGKVCPEFLAAYLMRWDFINAVRKYEEGTVYERMAVKPEDFLKFEMMLPPYEEQVAIAEILIVADREIELLRQDLEQEKRKKTALMQLLLTGIVRVNV